MKNLIIYIVEFTFKLKQISFQLTLLCFLVMPLCSLVTPLHTQQGQSSYNTTIPVQLRHSYSEGDLVTPLHSPYSYTTKLSSYATPHLRQSSYSRPFSSNATTLPAHLHHYILTPLHYIRHSPASYATTLPIELRHFIARQSSYSRPI